MCQLLTAWGFEVDADGDADAALKTLTRRRPDIIVSDLSHLDPEPCGLIRRMRLQVGEEVFIVAYTGRAEKEAAARAAGADAFALKPDVDALERLLTARGASCLPRHPSPHVRPVLAFQIVPRATPYSSASRPTSPWRRPWSASLRNCRACAAVNFRAGRLGKRGGTRRGGTSERCAGFMHRRSPQTWYTREWSGTTRPPRMSATRATGMVRPFRLVRAHVPRCSGPV
jgi:CheY-like chemotaxis protein